MSKSFEISLAAKGVAAALIISFILTLVLSLVYYFTSLQESALYSLLVAGVSVLAASFYFTFKAGSKGLIYGLTIGIGFFILSVIIFYIFYIGNPSWLVLLEKFVVSLITGIVGGTLGAVFKR